MVQNEDEANIYQEILFQRGLVQEDPESTDNHYQLGLLLMEAGDFKSALESMKTATYLVNKHGEAHFNQGLCYQHLSLLDSAIAAYELALSFIPENADIWSNLGLIMYQRGDLTNSILNYIKAASLAPKSPMIWQNLSYVQYAYGKYEDAVKSIKKALKLDESEENWGQLGLSLYASRQYQESCDALTASLDINEQQAEIWNCLGNCLTHLNQPQSAQSAFYKAVEMTPDNPDFWFNLAELHILNEQTEEAINCLKRVISINERDIEALSTLGKLHVTSNPLEAIKYFEKYLEYGSSHKDILTQLAGLYSDTDDKKTYYYRCQIKNLDPYDLDNNRYLVDLYLKLGAPEKAYDLLYANKNLQYQNINHLNRLAQYYQFKNIPDKELFCIEKILELDTDHSLSWQRLGEIALSNDLIEKTAVYFQKIKQPFQISVEQWKHLLRLLIRSEQWFTVLELTKKLLPSIQFTHLFWIRFFKQFRQKKQILFFTQELLKSAELYELSASAIISFSELLHQFGQTKYAIEVLNKAATKCSGAMKYYLSLANYHIVLKNYGLVISLLTDVIEQFPKQAAIYYFLAEAYLKQNDPLNAARTIQAGLDLEAENGLFWIQLGDLELSKGAFKKAITMYEQSITHQKTDEGYRKMGLALLDQDSVSEAKVFFYQSLEFNRNHHASHYHLSKILLQEKNLVAARKHIQFALAKNRYRKSYWELAKNIFSELKLNDQEELCQQRLKNLV